MEKGWRVRERMILCERGRRVGKARGEGERGKGVVCGGVKGKGGEGGKERKAGVRE